MKLNARAMAMATGLIWGGGLLLTGVAAVTLGGEGDYYGKDFLLMVASVYPGYRGVPEIGDVLLGTGIGLVDGAVAGFLLASIYNMCAGDKGSKA
jgi:hypothetical protein